MAHAFRQPSGQGLEFGRFPRLTAKRSLQFGHLQGRQGIAVGNMALQAAAV
jgi:hypothetical protein